ncbi:hypothetical protein B0H10DRAFT_2235286 [Mycena sp. CBHHK59/15]|nr:hypothetical protein B0H10DRAFT_2235286 [Mycena sp. CBHHK59/15]
MYSALITLALCLAAVARPTALTTRQLVGSSPAGTQTGIACTDPEGCFNGDVVTCINGNFVVTQSCTGGTTCLTLPINNDPSRTGLGCATTEVQTALFANAFGGIENIPTDD